MFITSLEIYLQSNHLFDHQRIKHWLHWASDSRIQHWVLRPEPEPDLITQHRCWTSPTATSPRSSNIIQLSALRSSQQTPGPAQQGLCSGSKDISKTNCLLFICCCLLFVFWTKHNIWVYSSGVGKRFVFYSEKTEGKDLLPAGKRRRWRRRIRSIWILCQCWITSTEFYRQPLRLLETLTFDPRQCENKLSMKPDSVRWSVFPAAVSRVWVKQELKDWEREEEGEELREKGS